MGRPQEWGSGGLHGSANTPSSTDYAPSGPSGNVSPHTNPPVVLLDLAIHLGITKVCPELPSMSFCKQALPLIDWRNHSQCPIIFDVVEDVILQGVLSTRVQYPGHPAATLQSRGTLSWVPVLHLLSGVRPECFHSLSLLFLHSLLWRGLPPTSRAWYHCCSRAVDIGRAHLHWHCVCQIDVRS